MLLLWHPDRFKAGHPLAKKAHEKTRAINDAYDTLKSYRATPPHSTQRDVSSTPRHTQQYDSPVQPLVERVPARVQLSPFTSTQRQVRSGRFL